MTLPANIRVNMSAPFPATVKGSAAVVVGKQNGIWTISLSFAGLANLPLIVDPAHTFVMIWNSVTGVYNITSIGVLSTTKAVKFLTGVAPLNSPYAAQPDDEVLIVKQAAGAPFTVTVDWSSRSKPLRVIDGKGDALANNITITPGAGQTQMASVNYSYIIDGNGGSITLTPLPDGSGAY